MPTLHWTNIFRHGAISRGRFPDFGSRTVVDLVVGSGIAFTERGEHELKGVPGRWKLFAVDSPA